MNKQLISINTFYFGMRETKKITLGPLLLKKNCDSQGDNLKYLTFGKLVFGFE